MNRFIYSRYVDMSVDEVIKKLHSLKNPKNVAGMARFGINLDKTLGVSIPVLRTR